GAMHGTRPHTELAQVGLLLALPMHAMPHLLQFFTSTRESTSQPSLALPLQSRKPMLQEPTPHTALAQPATPLATAGQLLPQAPQFLASLPVSTSQPLPAWPSQSRKVVEQEPMPHRPPAQPGIPLTTAGQAMPHLPQFLASVLPLASQPLA